MKAFLTSLVLGAAITAAAWGVLRAPVINMSAEEVFQSRQNVRLGKP